MSHLFHAAITTLPPFAELLLSHIKFPLHWPQKRLNRVDETSVEARLPSPVQRGRFTLGFVPSPSAPKGTVAVNDTGKFLWHWRRENGRWLLAAAAWNSDLPVKP